MNNDRKFKATASDITSMVSIISRLPGVITELLKGGKVDILVQRHTERRSVDQNRLQRKWVAELAAQGDMTSEEYRGLIKLRYGVPILRRDIPEFAEKYDRLIKGRPYEEKLELMMEPLDFPVTRLMSKAQKHEYLDTIYREFTQQGFRLTDPSLRGMDQYREAA